MGAFTEDGTALVRRGAHEAVRIESRGTDAVRVAVRVRGGIA